MESKVFDILVVGSGPAGLSAAVNGRVRNKSVAMVSGRKNSYKLEKAAVIAHIQYCSIGGNIFFTDGDHFGTRQADHLTECPVDNGQGTFVLQPRIELANDPFHQHKRSGQDQE